MSSRALFHDVRGVLGAAASNIEFLRARDLGTEAAPVLDEVAHELRLVSDVIALVGSAVEDRVVEIDLRAALFVQRASRPFSIDGTGAPFPVCASRRAILEFAAAMLDASSRGAGIRVSDNGCTVHGLDRGALDGLRAAAVVAESSLVATVEDEALILRRKD